jgi:molybdopterin-guanine dinucleotide biosynthesis protein A
MIEKNQIENISRMNAFILAGGKSKRMNTDKAYLKYNGKHFIDLLIETTAQLFDRVYVVGRIYAHPLVKESILDDVQDIGPLGGIYTALKHTEKSLNYFIAIDYPLVNSEIILFLAQVLLQKPREYEGIIPVTPDGPHPLFAFYSRSCLASIEKCIAKRCYQIRCISNYCKILYLNLKNKMANRDFDRIKKCFININSEEDFKALKKIK